MSVETTDLAAWLTQIWDEQDRAARKAGGDVWTLDGGIYRGHPTDEVVDWVYGEADEHIALNDPAAVLARIAADRQILADYEDHVATYRDNPTPFGEGQRFGLLLALARIAEANAHRPGYREEWKP